MVYTNKWRIADFISSMLAILGLLIALFEYELSFVVSADDRDSLTLGRNILRLIILITSIISVSTIVIRYYYKRKWQNLPIPKEVQNQIYNNDYTNLMRQNRRKRFISYKFIIDIIICLICPIPYYEISFYLTEFVTSQKEEVEAPYLLSDMILIFMFSRFYLMIRNVFNHTEFSDPYAKLHCERHGFSANTRFCFKCYLSKYPALTVISTLLTSIFILSYILRIAEKPFFKAYKGWADYSPLNSIYMVIVTMTTVGFGDYVPYTTLGKIITMLTALWGAFIISLLIVSVNAIFTLSPKQKTAYTKLIRVRAAAKCIISALRYHVINQKYILMNEGRESQASRLTAFINEEIVKKHWKSFDKRIKKFKEISRNFKISQEQTLVTSKLTKIETRVDNLEKLMIQSLRLLK